MASHRPPPPHWLRHSGRRFISAFHGSRKRRPGSWPRKMGTRTHCRALRGIAHSRRSRTARIFRAPSRATFRRPAPARGCCARTRRRPFDTFDGRALWRARSCHARGIAARIFRAVAPSRQNHCLRHPRFEGSSVAGFTNCVARKWPHRCRCRASGISAHRASRSAGLRRIAAIRSGSFFVTPWTFFVSHRAEILDATLDHVALVLIAMFIAIAVGVPLGMLIVQRPALRTIALGVASVFQTIPSLALFGFLIPIPFIGGIGRRTAIVALVLYALLPILRNTYVGLTSIEPAILEAAEAMGMTNTQILTRVRLPLALGIILAGIRTATVITIGVATIAAAIGAGGLGTFIFRGVAMVSDAVILAGAIPAALLAILADVCLALLERRLRAI